MKIFKTVNEMKNFSKSLKKEGKTIAFVPTMGYLHNGHLSLIKKAKEKADIVIASIFVNPIQFGPNEDLDKYPRDFERDENLLISENVDALFYPNIEEMYKNHKTYVNVLDLDKNLCGAKREGHFQGVCTVVLKLFNIVIPDYAVFGLKDAQQLRIIEKMTEDLNLNVEILRGEILREDDGLAMSSRNKYLNSEERQEALILRKSLLFLKSLIELGEKNTDILINKAIEFIDKNSKIAKIDYIEIVDFNTIEKVKELSNESLIALAIYIGKTRLIDNIIVSEVK